MTSWACQRALRKVPSPREPQEPMSSLNLPAESAAYDESDGVAHIMSVDIMRTERSLTGTGVSRGCAEPGPLAVGHCAFVERGNPRLGAERGRGAAGCTGQVRDLNHALDGADDGLLLVLGGLGHAFSGPNLVEVRELEAGPRLALRGNDVRSGPSLGPTSQVGAEERTRG